MTIPSALTDHLGYWLRALSNGVSQAFARRLQTQGVTVAEWAMLRVMYDQDCISPTALADAMGLTKGAVSKLADRLLDKGLLERKPHPTDRRAHDLALTPQGRDKVPILAALADANDAQFFAALPAHQKRLLQDTIQQLLDHPAITRIPLD